MKTLLAIFSILIFASFNVEDEVSIPDDLDKETIILGKACLMNAIESWAYPDNKKDLDYSFKKCKAEMTKYPFKYQIIDAIAETYLNSSSSDYDSIIVKEVSKPDADVAKYEFKYVFFTFKAATGLNYYTLKIVDRKSGKEYRIIKDDYTSSGMQSNLRDVIKAIKKKYGK